MEQGYAGEYVVHDWFVSDEDGVVLWHVALSPFLPFFTVWLKVFFLGINRLWYVLFGGYYSRFWVIFNLFLVVLFSDTTPLLYSFLS